MEPCYVYDPRTKVFLTEAKADIVDGAPNLPAFSTVVPPPEKSTWGDNQSPFWDEESNTWELRADFSNVTFYDAKTKQEVHLLPGEYPDMEKIAPVPPEDRRMVWVPESGRWEYTLEDAKKNKLDEIHKAWTLASYGPCKTKVKGVYIGLDNTPLEALVSVPYRLEDRELMSKRPLLHALEWSEREDVKATPEEVRMLRNGMMVPRIMDLLADTSVVIKDYNGEYVRVSMADLHEIILTQSVQADKNLKRRWELEDRIVEAKTVDEVKDIDWGDLPTVNEYWDDCDGQV